MAKILATNPRRQFARMGQAAMARAEVYHVHVGGGAALIADRDQDIQSAEAQRTAFDRREDRAPSIDSRR